MGSTPGASKNFNSFIPDSCPAAALTLDRDGVVIGINEAAAVLLGCDREGVVGRPFVDLVGSESEDALLAHLEEARDTGGLCRCTLTLPETGRGERHVLLQTAHSSGNGGQQGLGMVVSDITDVVEIGRLAEEARANAERETRSKVVFLARLSHEIRSAMASMVGFAEILADEIPDARRELADVITQSGRHLLETLNAVMDLSRFEYHDRPVPRERINVVQKARARTVLFQSVTKKPTSSLEFKADSESAIAVLNETYLDRILHNLIDNAIKFTPKGKVEVSVEERDDQVWIYVADTGMGIDDRFLPRLFEPFEREKRTAELDDEGVGLGLAITKYLVEAMGGRIYVCSTRDEGTTFTVSFPSPGQERKGEGG